LEYIKIVEQAIAGDDESFLFLMKDHKEVLYRTALAFMKNEHDAREAMQEVTYRAYKKIHTIKEPAYVKTWLTRIMMNYCQDQLKKNKRFTHDDHFQEPSTTSNYAQIELQEALKSLTEQEQQLVYLKYFQDVKIKEIAVIENIPEGTVKSRLHKIMRTLREHFNEKGDVKHV
jgi:RNA polymerase sigma factor (sigma-70 family)